MLVPLFLLPGNHDLLDPSTIYDDADITAQMLSHLHVLRESTPGVVRPGLEIVGAPRRTKRSTGGPDIGSVSRRTC